MTETEAKWAERIRRWRASGKTAKEFAGGQGFEGSTLRYWASMLKRRDSSKRAKAVAARAPQTRPVAATPVRLVRVRPMRRAPAGSMVVAVGAARIELRRGFDHALLREVVATLGGDA
jgi:transposase